MNKEEEILKATLDKLQSENEALKAEIDKLRVKEVVPVNEKFFTYSESSGFILYTSVRDAQNSAQEKINECRKDAIFDGEWLEEVKSICWGKIIEKSTEVIHKDSDGEESADYLLHNADTQLGHSYIEPIKLVVPWAEELDKVINIRASIKDFDGDRRGMMEALEKAEDTLIRVIILNKDTVVKTQELFSVQRISHEELTSIAKEVGGFLRDLSETYGVKIVESDDSDSWAQMQRFAAIVAAKAAKSEREACAQMVSNKKHWKGFGGTSYLCPHTKALIVASILAGEEDVSDENV